MFTYRESDALVMSGRPVLQSSLEYHAWKMLDSRTFPKGGISAIAAEVEGIDGSVSSKVLVMLIGELASAGLADRERLRRVVSKARATDCLPSIEASEVLLKKGDPDGAEELLSMSEGSQEKSRRSLMLAKILMVRGDKDGASKAARCAYSYDPSCREAYDILSQIDPEGGWPQRRNIQDVLEGGRPSQAPSTGRIQDLYSIYYDWFTGRREVATNELINSPHYRSRDPEFLLASARMSMDERDWRSALMVYSELLSMEPLAFVNVEAAEAAMGAGDPPRALRCLEKADPHQRRVMKDVVRAYMLAGDRSGMLGALRMLLDSETSGSDEYVAAVRFLIGRGMERDAISILDKYSRFVGDDSDTLTMRSVLLMRSGDYPAAKRAASKAVNLDKNNDAARAQLARILYLMDKGEAAGRECDGILARDPGNSDALALKRDLQMSDRDYESAASTCRRMLESDPSDVQSLMTLAVCMSNLGDTVKASDMFRDVLRIDGSRDRAVGVVSAMVSCGMYRDAELLCNGLERTYPKDVMLRRLKGNAQYALGDYLKASVSFSDAAAMDPHDPVLWHSKGMADEARGDLESAEDAYNRALLLDQGEAEYWVSKAAVQERSKDRFGAVESLNRAIELDPSSVYPLVRKAVILASAGKTSEALYYLRMAAVIEPGNVRIMDLQAESLVDIGDLDEAIRVLRGRIAIEETESSSLRLGRLLLSKGDRPGAIGILDGAIALHPDSEQLKEERSRIAAGDIGPRPEPEPEIPKVEPEPEKKPAPEDAKALCAMAVNLLDAGDIKGAMRMVDRALKVDAADPDINCLKARVVLAKGDFEGASFLAENAIRVNPSHAGLHRVNALAKEAKGDLRSALAEIDAAISCVDDAESNRIKGRILEASGYPERAANSYAKAVSLDPEDLATAEAQARQQIAAGNLNGAASTIAAILRRDPTRESAIMMKAEVSDTRNDDAGVMSAYSMLLNLDEISDGAKIRMVRMLEERDHKVEARTLMGGPQRGSYDASVQRAAEKALRRAFTTRTSANDPDILDAIGLDPDTASKVSKYIADIPDIAPIVPEGSEFEFMEKRSHDIIVKLKWTDLESQPELPLEKVFVSGGFRDADSAKELVAYVRRAMLSPPGHADERLSKMAMGLMKNMTVYEIISQCDIGVYEAVAVKGLIV